MFKFHTPLKSRDAASHLQFPHSDISLPTYLPTYVYN